MAFRSPRHLKQLEWWAGLLYAIPDTSAAPHCLCPNIERASGSSAAAVVTFPLEESLQLTGSMTGEFLHALRS